MSIIGAIATATAIGSVGTNFIFNYTKREYQEKINELDRLIERLQSHLEKLENLRSEISSFWDDEEAESTKKNLDLTIMKVRNNMFTCQSLSETFKKTVDQLDGSKDVLSNLLGDAFGALSSIGD